jgi:hypothetical protein
MLNFSIAGCPCASLLCHASACNNCSNQAILLSSTTQRFGTKLLNIYIWPWTSFAQLETDVISGASWCSSVDWCFKRMLTAFHRKHKSSISQYFLRDISISSLRFTVPTIVSWRLCSFSPPRSFSLQFVAPSHCDHPVTRLETRLFFGKSWHRAFSLQWYYS